MHYMKTMVEKADDHRYTDANDNFPLLFPGTDPYPAPYATDDVAREPLRGSTDRTNLPTANTASRRSDPFVWYTGFACWSRSVSFPNSRAPEGQQTYPTHTVTCVVRVT